MSKLALLLLLCTELAMAGDLKIVTRHSSDSPMDQPRTETIYLHGQRERREFHAGNFTGVTIYQCDLHRMISFNEESKSYRVWPLDEHGRMTMPAGLDLMPASRLTRSGNKVTFVETVKDTGERKDFFGFTAKRLVKTTTVEPRQTSCSNYGEGEQVDGWYIEAPGALGCTPQSKGLFALASSGRGCVDDIQFKHSGPYVTGIPVQQKTSTLGAHNFTTRIEPVEIAQQPLDPKLFEVPPGYSEQTTVGLAVRYYWERLKQAVARMF